MESTLAKKGICGTKCILRICGLGEAKSISSRPEQHAAKVFAKTIDGNQEMGSKVIAINKNLQRSPSPWVHFY